MATGYRFVKAPDGHKGVNGDGYIYEHILVAEKMLGRELKSDEVVHHIDKNKKNNDPSNLMVFATNADHAAFHKGALAYKDGDVYRTEEFSGYTFVCEQCGRSFNTSRFGRGYGRKFCSPECSHASKVKTEKDIAYIQNLLRACNGNFSEVARMYGISDSGLHKRLRKSGLPYRSEDYRQQEVYI